MPTSRISKTATIDHVLVSYDGPQLLLLLSDRGTHLIAHAVERENFAYPIVGCEPLERNLSLYMQGKVDLRFVFRTAAKSKFFIADLGKGRDPLPLARLKPSQVNEDVLPEPGIFSSVHTHHPKSALGFETRKQRFLIDGSWEARDFSQLHGKMADIYSLQSIARRLVSHPASPDESSFLKRSIADRPWQGGGSYLSFYGTIKQHAYSIHPLRVVGIEYHSPGFVEVEGQSELLSELVVAITSMIQNDKAVTEKYKAIRRALKKDSLLGETSAKDFSSERQKAYILDQVTELANGIALHNVPSLLDACDNNVALIAKLVLSYFRRVRVLAKFYVEGRVKTG